MEQVIALGIAGISGTGWFISKVFGRMRHLEDRIDQILCLLTNSSGAKDSSFCLTI